MSLAALITKATATAFAAAGDLVLTATWRQQVFGAYDPATGVQAVTNTDTAVDYILGELSKSERADSAVSERGIRLFIKASTLGAVIPREKDFVIAAGVTYQAKRVKAAGTADLWDIIADI